MNPSLACTLRRPASYVYGVFVSLTLVVTPCTFAGFQDDIGFTRLKQERSAGLPDGTNVSIAMIEAISSGNWAPEAKGELVGKDLRYAQTPAGYTTHAYEVGAYLIGKTRSIVPQINSMTASSRSSYAYTSLKAGVTFFPTVATWDVENHSWGGDFGIDNTQILQRMDYRVNRDRVVIVAGIDNGSTSKLLPVVANLYNGIAVGVSSGNHARSGSTLEGSGRQKPDLVAPGSATSYATPMVASSAAFLISEIKRTSAYAPARHPAAVKALLLAGATKAEFPAWTNSTTKPLDKIYGAGELNIYNSYSILTAGRTVAGGSATSGWDVATTAASAAPLTYTIDVPAGQTLTLSAVVTWHRQILASGTNWNTSSGALYPGTSYARMAVKMANIDVILRRIDTSAVVEITRSAGIVDNVEHIYRRDLPAGRYTLNVIADQADATYAIAWQGQLSGVPVVAAASAPVVTVAAPVVTAPVATAPLAGANVGTVSLAGVRDYDAVADDYIIAGGGVGLTGWTDAFYYASQSASSSTTAVVCVEDLDGATAARAGLSMRNSVDPKSYHASLLVSATGEVSLVRRTSTTSSVLKTVSAGALPVWLKVARAGNTVTAAYSKDGNSWTTVGSVDASFTSVGRVGLAVSSGSATSVATAEFSHFSAK